MKRLWLSGILLMLLPLTSTAQSSSDIAATGQATLSINGLLDGFTNQASHWTTVTTDAGVRLLGILAVIDLSLALYKKALQSDKEITGLIAIIVRWIITVGFFLWCIQNAASILGSIPKSFETLAGQASGLGALNPSQMFMKGLNLATSLASSVSVLNAVLNPFISLITATACLCLVLAFTVLAFQMFAALVHVYILIGVAPILLAGGGLSFTREWAISQFKGAVSTGVNILVIYLIAGVVTSFIPGFQAAIDGASLTNIAPVLTIFGAGFLILLLAFKAPSIASAIMSGTSSLSGNDMVGFGMATLATAVGGATMALKGLAGAAGAAGGLGEMFGGGGGQISPAGRTAGAQPGYKSLSEVLGVGSDSGSSAGSGSGGADGGQAFSPAQTAQTILGPLGGASAGSGPRDAGGNASDAGIGGLADTTTSTMNRTSPQNDSSSKSLGQRLDSLNDSVQRGLERSKAHIPEATHSGTVHIDSRLPGE